jgi:hypothetical protein
MRGVTLNFGWNRTSDYQQIFANNSAVPLSAWTPFQITNPLNGAPITVYNLQPSYFGLVPNLHQTNSPQSLRANSYNGFETSATARLRHGIFVAGGWTLEKQTDKACDESANTGGNALNDPNTLRFCDQSGGLYQNLGPISGIPYRNEFKLQTNIPIKYGIEVSASLYSDPVFSTNFASTFSGNSLALAGVSPLALLGGNVGGFKQVNWSIGPSTKYPANCDCPNPGGLVDPGLAQGAETIQLVAPGSRFTPRLNQFDLGFRKVFHIREKYTLMGEAQIFNLFNVSTVLTESYTLGSSIAPFVGGGPGGTPSVIENARMLRLNLQFKF